MVAIAASAGGIKALQSLFGVLPAEFPVPIAVVQHLAPSHPSMIVPIMRRATGMRVEEARQGEALEAGTIYFAPPNRHLLVSPERKAVLVDSELVHFVRPSADLLFESLAGSCKNGVLGVVLTGNGIDGAQGVTAIKKMGGIVLVQDAEEAEFSGMPKAAIATGDADHVLLLRDIGPKIVELVEAGE